MMRKTASGFLREILFLTTAGAGPGPRQNPRCYIIRDRVLWVTHVQNRLIVRLSGRLLHKKNNMALFTRGLTNAAKLGVNTRIGAAVAFYHKNVRVIFFCFQPHAL